MTDLLKKAASTAEKAKRKNVTVTQPIILWDSFAARCKAVGVSQSAGVEALVRDYMKGDGNE